MHKKGRNINTEGMHRPKNLTNNRRIQHHSITYRCEILRDLAVKTKRSKFEYLVRSCVLNKFWVAHHGEDLGAKVISSRH